MDRPLFHLWLILLALLFLPPATGRAQADGMPRVEFFSPQGSTANVKQVMARFSAAMVAFGDPRQESPFAIDCPVAGQGRWLDDRQWVFDFAEEPAAAITCSFTLRPGLTSLAGQQVAGETRFSFDTGGPALKAYLPDVSVVYGSRVSASIEEEQIFVLLPSAPVRQESVIGRVFFEIEGVTEIVPAVFLEGKIRDQFLSGLRNNPDAQRWGFATEYSHEARERMSLKSESVAAQVLVVKCQRPLPPDKEVTLVWEAGITAPNGLATKKPQRLLFKVEPLGSASMTCERTSEKADCVPISNIDLSFGIEIPPQWAGQVRLVAPDGKTWKPTIPDYYAPDEAVGSLTFEPPFPEQTELRIRLPKGLVDRRGRSLANADQFPLKFKTAPYPPLVKFPASFGIFERKAEPILPVSMRNVEAKVLARLLTPGAENKTGPEVAARQEVAGKRRTVQEDGEIIGWIKRLREQRSYGYTNSVFDQERNASSFTVPKLGGENAFAQVGIPLTPGFHIIELASPKLGAILFGQPGTYHVNTAALVTNLAVHLKWGNESSLVWVTALDSGKPVADAKVRISDLESGHLLWEGVTSGYGMAKIPDGILPGKFEDKKGWGNHRELLASARKDDDLSFALSSWNDGIAPYEFGLDMEFFRSYDWHMGGNADWRDPWGYDRTNIGHTVFDRPLFRAGETVHMKHLLRQGAEKGFALAAKEKGFTKVLITHQGSGQHYELPLSFTGGVAVSEWQIPEAAKLGTYLVSYRNDDGSADGSKVASGSFKVAEFRVPSMRGEVHLPGRALINPSSAPVNLAVHYLAGGPAQNLPVTLRVQTTERSVFFADYPEFSFFGGDVQEGLVQEKPLDENGDRVEDQVSPAMVTPLTLDQAGSARTTVNDLPQKRVPQALVAELEYRDANGETLTVADRIPIWPSGVVLGFKSESEFITKERFQFPVLALDTSGKPLVGQEVKVDLFREDYHVSRKRLLGGFYSYDRKQEIVRIGKLCQGRTDKNGILLCQGKTPPSGNYILRASGTDAAGNLSVAKGYAYVYGKKYWGGSFADSDRMDLLTNRRSYQPGETARFEVRMPFREATALVTVEREGVIDAFTTHLSGAKPVVEVPIKANYGPNVYVSVLAVRGRIAAPPATAFLDLARPAFRLGYCRINVGWQGYALDVKVMSPREVYQTREQAEVRLRARTAEGHPPPAGTELAVAAVDEGLLELMPNRSWDLLDSMMQPRQIQVETATAQMQVVGKRHYGRKAIPSGGGGGRQPTRELFDTLLLWSPRVALDANGEATLQVPLNDSLTSFRIAAVASGESAFGSGFLSIRTTREVIIHSGLPSIVRSGDRFQGTITVRNGADRPLHLRVKGQVTPSLNVSDYGVGLDSNALPHYRRRLQKGAPDVRKRPASYTSVCKQASDKADGVPCDRLPLNHTPGRQQPLSGQELRLAPGAARELSWSMVVPDQCDRLDWTIAAQEVPEAGVTSKPVRDELKVTQSVRDPYPVRTVERTVTRLDQPLDLPVARPANDLPDKGGLTVEFAPRLSQGLSDLEGYMREYPYTCLEQRVSKAVALNDGKAWEKIMAALPPYLDKEGLLRFFHSDWCVGSPVLTAYVLAISQEAGFVIPETLRQIMLAGLGDFIEGKTKRESWLAYAPDLTLRKLMAIEALSRYPGVANSAMLSFPITPADLPLASLLDWIGILRRVEGIENRDEQLAEALALIRSRLYASGSTVSLPKAEDTWWLLTSADSTAVRAVLTVLEEESWRGEIPRFMLGTLNQQKKGRWDTTMANAWGRLLADRFSRRFEETPPQGVSRVTLTDQTRELAWQEQAEGGELTLAWPDRQEDLHLDHQGDGAPWVAVVSRAAIKGEGERANGYTIHRALTPVEQKVPGTWSRGDVARVRLDLTAQTAMGWVVVEDPIPAGATIVGRGLQRDSRILASGEKDDLRPTFAEAGQEWNRVYYDFVPAGKWAVEYTVRFNSSGTFLLPPSRVEAMYVPELYAERANPVLTIAEPRP